MRLRAAEAAEIRRHDPPAGIERVNDELSGRRAVAPAVQPDNRRFVVGTPFEDRIIDAADRLPNALWLFDWLIDVCLAHVVFKLGA